MRHPDRWDLPKGHCDRGESFEQTALRETAEETGFQESEIRMDTTFRFELSYPVTYKKTGDQVFTKRVVYFLGFVAQPREIDLTEHQSYQWFKWSPPHTIQTQSIDPLLDAVATHLGTSGD